jgi:anti-anti-sigma factor
MKLNPTVFTARAVLMSSAARGDMNAEKLLRAIDEDELFERKYKKSGGSSEQELYRFSSAYGTAVWIRNKISDRIFDAMRMTTFVDLGCGFNPRGLSLANHRYIRYYGIDLPPIADRMNAVTRPMLRNDGADEAITYHAADLTDRNSLRALFNGGGPLFIVTEGLMMYLTENEMCTVTENIAELLKEFGGVWLTGDAAEHDIYEYILKRLLGSDEQAVRKLIGSELSEKWRSLLFENSFVTLKHDALKEFLGHYGLDCRETDINRYIEDLDIPDSMRAAFESTDFLMMVPKTRGAGSTAPAKKSTFSLTTENNGGVLSIYVNGRLDTLSAPKLIEAYEAHSAEQPELPVLIDMAGCPYISSAGIRAFLILFRHTRSIKDGFSLRNIRPEVLDIINATGLSKLL